MVCEKKKNSMVIKLTGEIDHHKVEEIKDEIDEKFDTMKARNIIFDFSDVSFMDSAGVGLILGRFKNATRANGQAAIIGPSEPISRILDISGIFRIIKGYESVTSALKSME